MLLEGGANGQTLLCLVLSLLNMLGAVAFTVVSGAVEG